MAQISKNRLSEKTELEMLNNFATLLSSIRQTDEMKMFLATVFTPTEQIMIAKRLAIVILLEEKLTDAEIAEKLHLTRITVGKFRYYFQTQSGYPLLVAHIKKQQNYEEFKRILISLARYSIKAASGRI